MIKKILLFLSLTQFAHAENLAPEDSQFSGEIMAGYTHLVLKYLGAAYSEDVLVRLVGFPSFSPEYAVWLEEEGKQYKIVYESPEIQLWGYQMMPLMEQESVQVMNDDGEFVKDEKGLKELEEKYPKNPEDIPRKTCKKEIDKDLADKIVYVWKEMLLGTQYPREPTMGLDGETYHFSGRVNGYENYAGKVWSPSKDSKTGKLVEVAYLMVEYCQNGKRKTKKELSKKVNSFMGELQSTNKSIQPTAKASAD
ncbi:hypothetical protein P886_1164 [Alteromonadaceae bacterium 2753L.S.0a.02]|nr:hypothetical protein P886_1164 [Alteromonadaceae bacterium 2753L.S.0a.02]